MTRIDRLGLALLAGGLGLAVVNLLMWWVGWSVSLWQAPLSGVLMAGGLVLLAVNVMKGIREDAVE